MSSAELNISIATTVRPARPSARSSVAGLGTLPKRFGLSCPGKNQT